MTNRTRIGRRAPILLIMALAAVATIALADVIFVYTGTINVEPMTTQPLVFSTGPNAGPSNTAAEPYINFTGTSNNNGFTVTLVITNSSAVYYYEAGQLTVNTAGYIYVSSVATSYTTTTAPVQSMTIYIQNTSGSTVCSFQVISGGSPTTTPSSSCSLGAGTYYISIKVVPNLPVTSTSTETVTVTFGYNVIPPGASVPVPT